ncbi:MAG: hypothetical protein AAF655_22195 [Bacteroidota bacterium]
MEKEIVSFPIFIFIAISQRLTILTEISGSFSIVSFVVAGSSFEFLKTKGGYEYRAYTSYIYSFISSNGASKSGAIYVISPFKVPALR